MKIRGYFDYDQPDVWAEDTRRVGRDGFEVPDDVWQTYLNGQKALATIEELYDQAYRRLTSPKGNQGGRQ